VAAAERSFVALLGFALGVILATVVDAVSQGRLGPCHNPTGLLLFELVFLVGCTALWSENPKPMQGLLYVIVALSAVSMGIQAVAARTINTSGISTIVFTTAMVRIVTAVTGAVAGSATRESPPPTIVSEAAAFLAYACGALVMGMLALQEVRLAVWVPTVAVILALTIWAAAAALTALQSAQRRNNHKIDSGQNP